METPFKASNDIEVYARDGGTVQFMGPTAQQSGMIEVFPGSEWWEALREFFRAEEDERLGRWRWPENPDYVVYPRAEDVLVLFEMNGEGGVLYRRDDPVHDFEGQAARAYFDAHPEPKPWHHAKPGEAWKLTANGDTGPFVTMLTPSGAVHFIAGNGTEFIAEASDITDGRRIWPEES